MFGIKRVGSWSRDCSMGNLQTISNPFEQGAFCESNSYIYTWFVPHNIKELARMMGGESIAAQRLNQQFENSVKNGFGRKWVDYSNEPGMGLGHIF